MTGWLSRRSLRWRLMAVGLAGVAAALLVSGLLLYAAMTATLTRSVVDDARSSANAVAALVNAGRLPDPLPLSGAQVVQVLDAQNRVITSSVTADRLTPLVDADERATLLTGRSIVVAGSRAALSGELQVVGLGAGPAEHRVTVVAAVPTADLETTRRVVRVLLLVLFPLALAAMALVAWRVIGAALRPVDELREGADRIGAGPSVDERLPVPPARDEISALATTLNRMLDRLGSAQEKQRAFVADAAHELRSPLASMHTQLEVADRLREGSRLPADLLPEVDRLSGLVEDLLVLARAGGDSTGRRTEDVPLTGLLTEVASRCAGARVPVEVSPGPRGPGSHGPVVRASRPDLVRAVANLVDNAVRHAGSRVVLAARATSAGAELTVTDDGHGIRAEDRERVFDRFARLDEARDRDSGGSGLGLAITRELLRHNGARIVLEDAEPGVRAVVSFGHR